MKVLIADDSAFMRGILKDILKQTNWATAEVIEAENGQQAVEKYKAESPDLLLLDIVMPIKDGLSVLKEVNPGATAVMVSAVGQEQIIETAKALGAKEFIVKPFDFKKALEIINKIVPPAK